MILKLLRANNWIKNLLVFAPVIFSFNLYNKELLFRELLAFIGFCLTASAIYIMNDIVDKKKDAIHPRKKNRPLASGKVKPGVAYLVIFILVAVSFVISQFLSIDYMLVLVLYVILNLAYTTFLKKVNLIEILIVTLFFVLRILAGCAAIQVEPSQWIIMVTFFVAIFLTAIKRKSELIILDKEAGNHREVLKHYSSEFLDFVVYISATITIFGYVLYSMDSRTIETFSNSGLIYSSFFVVLGLFRFIQLSKTSSYNGESDPTFLILKDRFLQLTLLMWGASVFAILYVF